MVKYPTTYLITEVFKEGSNGSAAILRTNDKQEFRTAVKNLVKQHKLTQGFDYEQYYRDADPASGSNPIMIFSYCAKMSALDAFRNVMACRFPHKRIKVEV